MSENGSDRLKVVCPCGQHFSMSMPIGENVNTLRSSAFIAAHETPAKCVHCKQVFVAVIQATQVMWAAVPISAEQAATLDVNRVLRPTLVQ
jgi:hypothetical protein